MIVYTVYKTINLINQMFYIGVHKTSDPCDNYYGSSNRLQYAIKKYGIENFKKEILFIFETAEQAYSKEKELITQEILDSKKCYNLKLGGYGGWSYVNVVDPTLHEKSIQLAVIARAKWLLENQDHQKEILISCRKAIIQKFPNGVFFGKTHSDDTKRSIGLANSKVQTGAGNSQFGTKWITDGTLNKKIKKDQEIPNGWRTGRVQKKWTHV